MPLDNRTTELIAIGASIATNCRSCVEYHVGKAVEIGVDQQAVAQAIEVGRLVRKGAAANVDTFADGVLHKEPKPAGSIPTERWGCGCGWGPWSAAHFNRGDEPCGDR